MDARLLLDLAREVTGTLDLQEALERALRGLRTLTACDGGLIQLVEDDHLCIAAAVPPVSRELREFRPKLGDPISGIIAATGEPLYLENLADHELTTDMARRRVEATGLHTSYGVPLIMSGRPLGVVTLQAKPIDAFDEDVRNTVLLFAPTIASAVVQSRAFGRQQTALARVRMASDAITQGLAVAKYAMETGQDDVTREAIEDTLRQSRAVISDLLGDDEVAAGTLRRGS